MRLVVEQLAAPARCARRGPVSSTTASRATRCDDAEVLLDEQHRRRARETRSSARATSVTSSGASPFVGSSIEQQAVVVQQRAADREHLLLPARERAGRAACRARAARGRGRRRGRSAARRRARRGAGSRRRSGRRRRRGPRGRSRRRAGRSCASAASAMSSPASSIVPRAVDEPHERAQRRRLADAVAAEQRGDAAVGERRTRRPAGRATRRGRRAGPRPRAASGGDASQRLPEVRLPARSRSP